MTRRARPSSRSRRRRSSSARARRTTPAGSCARLGVTRALLVTDPGVAAAGHPSACARRSRRQGIEVVVFDGARVEPTLESLEDAAAFARDAGVDGFVSVGGGSAIDTAKVADLIVSHPGAGDGVRQPAGRRGAQAAVAAAARTSRSRPRAGTGSEATTVAVLDIPELRVKTRHLAPLPAAGAGDRRPRAGAHAGPEVDRVGRARRRLPRRRVLPRAAVRRAPAAGDARTTGRPTRARTRSPTCGRRKALEYGGRFLRRAVADADDVEARGAMMLAATMAGVGFGSAGVHIPHACAYPIAGLKHGLPAARLSGRPPLRPARAVGDRHRAGGVPLHLRGGARAPRARRGAAHGRAGERPGRAARRARAR